MDKSEIRSRAKSGCFKFSSIFCRKKKLEGAALMESQLKRCLGVLDVMFIAVGHMIGAGIYVLTGSIAKTQAGPSVVLSYVFSGIAALLSSFSYAEFGARFPRAGSAYTYAYVSVGEFWAFFIGWTVLLEYMIGNAAVARSWTGYMDGLVDHRISNFTVGIFGDWRKATGISLIAEYPDFIAVILIILVAIVVAIGPKFSATCNKFFVGFNIVLISFVVVYGLTFAKFKNWSYDSKGNHTGFFPYGLGGSISGAGSAFFAFIGFEALATAGEEAKNPKRTIPLATFGSLAIVTFLYVAMASTMTLMLPYDLIDPKAAFAEAFRANGAEVARIVISVGALAGMVNNMLTSTFALPRTAYAIADDGLLFAFLGRISKWGQVPLNAIIVFTILNAILAVIFDQEALIDFLSIGTLVAYTFVTACVIILRYQPAELSGEHGYDEGGNLHDWVPAFLREREFCSQGKTIKASVFMLVVAYFWFAITILKISGVWFWISLVPSTLLVIVTFGWLLCHKENQKEIGYKVPFVPFLPGAGILANVFMMTNLPHDTWIRMAIWSTIGFVIYFGYGIWHSHQRGNKHRNYPVSIEPTSMAADDKADKAPPSSTSSEVN